MNLRNYQEQGIHHILKRIQDGYLRMYADSPTGTGKSKILAGVAGRRRHVGRVLVLIHRQDIALQLADTLKEEGLDVGLMMQGHRNLTAPVVVATMQSLTPINLQDLIHASEQPIATILIDEAHHAVECSAYEQIITAIEDAYPQLQIPVIGYTATPYRSDKHSMLSLLPICAYERTIPDMVRAGWLAPLIWKPLRVDIDLATVATSDRSGEVDYAEEALSSQLIRAAIITDIAQKVAAHIEQRPTLVFAASVEHAERLAKAFCELRLCARAVSGAQSRAERERLFADWRAGTVQVVCNCSLLAEGFDFPEIAALVIARPTLSPSLYMQMLGRGTRPAPGKHDCLVLDVMGNHPKTSRQVVLPHIVGDSRAEGGKAPMRGKATDPLLKALLGAETGMGLSLLDPIGQSEHRWTAYRQGKFEGYFARVSQHEAAIVERDPTGSGLYRSRLHTKQPGQPPKDDWIQPDYLPLRQQVALVHQATNVRNVQPLSNKEARWLNEPATEKQIKVLQRMHPGAARRAIANGWTKRMVSDVITFLSLRKTLTHPPTVEEGNTHV